MNWQQRIIKGSFLGLMMTLLWFIGLPMHWQAARPIELVTHFASPVIAAPLSVGSAVARSPVTDKEVLTLSQLASRLNAPIQKSGALVVDLSGFVIDLRAESPESAAFAEQFYQQLQQRLNGQQPIGLDLSGSLVKGALDLARLSLRVPAYGDDAIPALASFKADFAPALLNDQTDTFVFQGPLWLSQTCFTGPFQADNLYFLGVVDAEDAIFTQMANWHRARFARSANFSQSQFQQESTFRSALFARRTRFNGAVFSDSTDWQSSTFHEVVRFSQSSFQSANFARSHWFSDADFSQSIFHTPVTFQKSRFDQALLFTEAQFEAAANFRQVRLQAPVSLRGALIRNQLDFGDARISDGVSINVADLDFNAGEAKILGSPGQLGSLFLVPSLASNEAVLQNLVRNFRLLEQVADANQVEYTAQRLRLAQLRRQLAGVGVAAKDTQVIGLERLQWALQWLLFSGLLLLSDYGTNVTLVFSVGVVATTLFGLMFWLVDRYRRKVPTALVPERSETVSILLGSGVSLVGGLGLLSQCHHPLQTLAAVSVVTIPLPAMLMLRLYQHGRYHDLMEVSYFVKNGALRELQVMIARLPIIPTYPFYRDRYQPLLTDRRWSWLNYLDFSLNNWFKFGFNDIRLRDESVPGLISALVWYQWGLGISYITLLLWTLSRTIPGLNLLLYF